MNPDTAIHALPSCLLRDSARHGALVILKTIRAVDASSWFESHALRFVLDVGWAELRLAAGPVSFTEG
jgi:hypothetical protein